MKSLVKTFENFQMDEFDLEKDSMIDQPEMENYMFMGNLQTIKRCVDELLEMDPTQVDQILQNGHNWALDHITTSKDDIEEVYNFLINETEPVEEVKHSAHKGDDTWRGPIEEPVSEAYECNECSMTYEAHEVDESMTCECGGMLKPVYEKW